MARENKDKWVVIVLLLVLVAFASCAAYQQQSGAVKGGAVGAGVGGVAGALVDRGNPWRGGIIGGVLGAVLGATVGDISDRGAYEASQANKPVEYYTEDRRGRYYAEPMEYNSRTRCHRVHEKVWEDGRLVKDRIREVC
jgi:hypothetical protein